MITLPIPNLRRRDIYGLKPEELLSLGVRLVFLDVDNTLMPYGTSTAPQRLIDWVGKMRGAGLELFILSNNKGGRPDMFASQLGLDFIKHARKPSTERMLEVCCEKGIPPRECAVIGDQIYTDVLCACRSGAVAVLVRPIKFSNPYFVVRYIAEIPFRILRRKHK